ncbi:MAG: type II toxin-antitoxin system VapC family toxin [Candidatus Limnocylindria bacterium]
MSFFVDANVIVYAAVPSRYREPCLEILDAIARGAAEGRTSTAVLEEVWHLELSGRAGRIAGLTTRAYSAFTPLLPVTDEIIARALTLDARRLGANDRIHVATALVHGIDAIVSADAGFDRVSGIRAVDPLDPRGRARLLSPGEGRSVRRAKQR